MSAIKLTIHGMDDRGICCLSGKEGEVLIVSFDDGTIREGALSQKSLLQLLRMKFAQGKPRQDTTAAEAKPVGIAVPLKP